MPYALDLSSSRAKLNHAKRHIDRLRSEIPKQSSAKGEGLRLRRQFEPAEGAVVFCLDEVIEIKDDWPFLFGNAINNLRSALDYLAWQLAIRYHKGKEPPETLWPSIQFPITATQSMWDNSRSIKNMIGVHRAKVKKFQPFKLAKADRSKGAVHWLALLREFSNADKHREVQFVYCVPAVLNRLSQPIYVDCVPTAVSPFRWGLPDARNLGDEVFRFLARPTGPNPDLHFDANVSAFVAVEQKLDVVDTLDTLAQRVERVIRSFED
jgi:hypothetical protein